MSVHEINEEELRMFLTQQKKNVEFWLKNHRENNDNSSRKNFFFALGQASGTYRIAEHHFKNIDSGLPDFFKEIGEELAQLLTIP